MCLGGGGGVPAAPARLPEAQVVPDKMSSYNDPSRRRRAANGTVFTSSQGLSAANTTTKTLLGQ